MYVYLAEGGSDVQSETGAVVFPQTVIDSSSRWILRPVSALDLDLACLTLSCISYLFIYLMQIAFEFFT